MYICEHCGETHESLPTYREILARDGEELWQEETICDICGGDLVEAEVCAFCGRYAASEICEICLEGYGGIDNAYMFGGWEFLKSQFSGWQIHDILLRELREAEKLRPTEINESVNEYLRENAAEFAKWHKEN